MLVIFIIIVKYFINLQVIIITIFIIVIITKDLFIIAILKYILYCYYFNFLSGKYFIIAIKQFINVSLVW